MLTIEQLSVHYGGVAAVREISLQVAKQEIVALLGSNGAGKTTTLRAVSGLVPYRGTIHYCGQNLAKIAPHHRIELGIAHVPEGRGIFPGLTVWENLRLASWGATKINYDMAYELFPRLRERRKQLVSTLSGGEQQMLAIARALLRNPTLLILDEPSMGLAPKLMQEVFAVLQAIHQRGVGILLVEQNAHAALQLAQRAYVLENGAVGLSGDAATFIADPKIKELYLS